MGLDLSLDENIEKQATVDNHTIRETMKMENKLWNTDEKVIIEKISFYLDSALDRERTYLSSSFRLLYQRHIRNTLPAWQANLTHTVTSFCR